MTNYLPTIWSKQCGQPPNQLCRSMQQDGVKAGVWQENEFSVDAVRHFGKMWASSG